VSPEPFESTCDRLSEMVDKMLHTRLLWERNEAPMLARLVELASTALEGRSEFELSEEGATSDVKRFTLKIHGNRIIAITMALGGGQVMLQAEAIDRSRYQVLAGPPVTADYAAVDEPWMAAALQELFGRIQG
jgi:hypothetical protein